MLTDCHHGGIQRSFISKPTVGTGGVRVLMTNICSPISGMRRTRTGIYIYYFSCMIIRRRLGAGLPAEGQYLLQSFGSELGKEVGRERGIKIDRWNLAGIGLNMQ